MIKCGLTLKARNKESQDFQAKKSTINVGRLTDELKILFIIRKS